MKANDTIVMIPINHVDPNPYQPREREDPDHVKQVALSIAERGLLQTPVARMVNGRAELAFGHTRLAAYKWLHDVQPNSNLAGDWSHIPVVVQNLSDLQMFEMAISENLDRSDLSPIEQARAMLVYREQFGKTSAEIGKLFGLSESAVRNKLRLLELPDQVKERIDQGVIAEGTARKLMVLDKLAPEKVTEIAEQIAQNDIRDPEKVSGLIENTLRDKAVKTRQIRQMWNGRWDKGEPRGGSGLWPLSWTAGRLPAPTFAQFEKIYQGPTRFEILYPEIQPGVPDQPRTYTIKQAFSHLLPIEQGEYILDRQVSIVSGRIAAQATEALNLVNQLISPPACTACPLHSVLDGIHYCGLVACWKNKRQAWYQQELKRLAEELGISVFDRENDGPDYEPATQWDSGDKWKKWLKEKADHLRLKTDYREYQEHFLTESKCVVLVSVRPEVAEKKRREAQKELNQANTWANERMNREKSDLFIQDVALPAFTPLFSGLKGGALLVVARALASGSVKNEKEARARLAASLIRQEVPWDAIKSGPMAVAKHLQGVAKEAGIQLTEGWLEIAENYSGEVDHENPD